MIRNVGDLVCSVRVFFLTQKTLLDLPLTREIHLEPHWNLWQKPLFSLAFETHVLFLGLGHLFFRLIVKHFVLRASWRDPKYCVLGARSLTQDCLHGRDRKERGRRRGEKRERENGILREEYMLISSSKVPANYHPASTGYWTIHWNSFTIPKSFERSAKRVQVLVHFLSTCS